MVGKTASCAADPANLAGWSDAGIRPTLQAAALLFFAFAGYVRIATLGEEGRDPARTTPRAIPIALAVVVAVYAVVGVAALSVRGPTGLATGTAPLAEATSAGSLAVLTPAGRIGGALTSAEVLLSRLAATGSGVLPTRLRDAGVHPARPDRAGRRFRARRRPARPRCACTDAPGRTRRRARTGGHQPEGRG